MPVKRYTFKYPAQFVPRSNGDLLTDDPTESKNVIVPLEPENWKYGIYYNDGYDYQQHLVTLSEFQDETRELPKIDFNKQSNLTESLPTAFATVVNEIEFNDKYVVDNTSINEKVAAEKMRLALYTDFDEDIMFAIDNAKSGDEMSDNDLLDDNFIEQANRQSTIGVMDSVMAREFFDYNSEDDDDDDEKITFDDGMADAIETLQNDYKDENKLELSSDKGTRASTMTLAFKHSFEKHLEKKESDKKKLFINPIDPGLRRFIVEDETEYDEKEVDKAVDQWAGRKRRRVGSVMVGPGKISKNQPTIMIVEKTSKKRKTEDKMDTESECSSNRGGEAMDFVLPNVSQFHVPRKQGETAEEKRERKKNIKVAKRSRQEKKKEIKEVFAALR